ncbi:hypothetical protein [Hymenobacter busanensis]|nr:hypothetical protein [Hymenobacter busanensis]QHJ05952.1 hypothetical protein GUY19_01050 [Hymenobacter busanensis]
MLLPIYEWWKGAGRRFGGRKTAFGRLLRRISITGFAFRSGNECFGLK